jgi:uncharacterized protein (DUF2249 family)
MISGDMMVAHLLDEHPELAEVLARYHAPFAQLSDPLRRRVMAPRITVADAAHMAGVSAGDLLAALRAAVGEVGPPRAASPPPALSPEARGSERHEMPALLAAVPEGRRVHLDVRESIRQGEEPFARIMAAVKTLARDQAIVLHVPFEPIPLYDVLGKRGFGHWTERHAADDWSVSFYREAAEPGPVAAPAGHDRRVIDVRGLEPPRPMVEVLEAIDRLAPGAELEVLHDRRPALLYPLLEDRGYVHDTDEPELGLVRIRIRRGDA